MENSKLILYGNGGHSKVLADCAKLNNKVVSLIFDDLSNPYNSEIETENKIIIAIGNNVFREEISIKIKHDFTILIHPSAIIADDVIIGEGTVILANAVVQSGSNIGKHVIVNPAVVIDHDAIIEDFVCIYSGSYIGGNATVTKGRTVEPNTTIYRNTKF